MTTTRRLFLFTAAAAAPAMALPAIALPAPADTIALRLWAERQTSVERLRGLTAAYERAWANVPYWADSGSRMIDETGAHCDAVVNWPLDPDVTAPPAGWRVVRPSISECKKLFDFQVRVFRATGKYREKCRATMRRNIRTIVARLRERRRLFYQLGITELNRQIEATTDAIIETEGQLFELGDSPNVSAAHLMMEVCQNCGLEDFTGGNGYSGAMAIAAMALKPLLPSLSGLIRDHAAFFVDNPGLPLRQTMFAAA
jgi:hypothetical protein